MERTIKELPATDFRQALDELGLVQPEGWAFLPHNLQTVEKIADLYHCDSVMPLRKLFKGQAEAIAETPIEPGDVRIPRLALRYIDWIGPTLFFSGSVLAESPNVVSVCLNVISNYVYDLFRGRSKEVKAKLRIALEGKKGQPAKLLEYEGDVEGLRDLPKIIKELNESGNQ